jgi:uncharacterized protein (DUF2252 family)
MNDAAAGREPPRLHDPFTDRIAYGEAQRAVMPLADHAAVHTDGRADPLDLLTEQDRTRVARFVPIRHGRMSPTPFAFYRGAATVMAHDLGASPSSGVRVQLCGDAHLANFGLYFGPDRHHLFDLNDFDETLPGPFEWDVKRLAASVTIAGRENGHDAKEMRNATRGAVAAYRRTVASAAHTDPLDLTYRRIEVTPEVVALLDSRQAAVVDKAARKNQARAVARLTVRTPAGLRIVEDPPYTMRVPELHLDDPVRTLGELARGYLDSLTRKRRRLVERYHVVDVAHRIVGVGSVGTRCLVVLAESGNGFPLVMQFKEATTSVLEPYAGASEFDNDGRRVVEGQQLLQAASDILLGWSRHHLEDRPVDFYFRQLWDGKGAPDVERLGPKRLARYADLCGAALGLAHARAGDAAAITGYLGDDDTFDRAVAKFASAYADINEADHGRHRAAIAQGRIDAEFGV